MKSYQPLGGHQHQHHRFHRYFRGICLSGGISVYPYVLVSAADLLRGRSDADFPRHGHRRGRYPAGRYRVCDAVPGKQEAGSRKSLISIPKAGAAAPAFAFGNSPHNNPKHSDAVPAGRPGDSQGGGFSAAPLEPAYFSMFLPGQEHCLRRNLHRKLLRDDR